MKSLQESTRHFHSFPTFTTDLASKTQHETNRNSIQRRHKTKEKLARMNVHQSVIDQGETKSLNARQGNQTIAEGDDNLLRW